MAACFTVEVTIEMSPDSPVFVKPTSLSASSSLPAINSRNLPSFESLLPSKFLPFILGTMPRLCSFNLQRWIQENRHLLKPPVGNKLLFNGELKIMLVAGPNSRSDYHIEEGEEWFYQLEGTMVLKVVENGQFYDVVIGEGDTFCLPPKIPHSPQRPENSLGLVIERRRRSGELDTLQWYCQNHDCRKVLYTKSFFCADLTKDLLPIISDYYSHQENRTCKSCGFVEHPPAASR